MNKMREKWVFPAGVMLAAGLLACAGCSTERGAGDGRHRCVQVEIPANDLAISGPFAVHEVMLDVKTLPGVPNAVTFASHVGEQLQGRLRLRGHGVPAPGGALVELQISVKENRPFSGFAWRAYEATTDVKVSGSGKSVKRRFVVDGQKLSAGKFQVTEEAALAPVRAELLKQVDEWLAGVLKNAPPAALPAQRH